MLIVLVLKIFQKTIQEIIDDKNITTKGHTIQQSIDNFVLNLLILCWIIIYLFTNLSPPYYFKENDKKIPAHFQKFSNAMEGSYSEK